MDIFLKKTNSPSPSCYQLQQFLSQGWGLGSSSLLHAGIFNCFAVMQAYVGSLYCCEFMCHSHGMSTRWHFKVSLHILWLLPSLWSLFHDPLALVLVVGIDVHLQLSSHGDILCTWTVTHLCTNHYPAARSFSDQGWGQHKSMDRNTNIQKAIGNMTMQTNNSMFSPRILTMFIILGMKSLLQNRPQIQSRESCHCFISGHFLPGRSALQRSESSAGYVYPCFISPFTACIASPNTEKTSQQEGFPGQLNIYFFVFCHSSVSCLQ